MAAVGQPLQPHLSGHAAAGLTERAPRRLAAGDAAGAGLPADAAAPAGAARPSTRCGTARRTRSAPRCSAPRPGVNISTVYRTLELLEELGLVTHTHLGHGAPTYHAADGERPPAPGLPGLRRGHRDRGRARRRAGRRRWPSSTASRPTWPTSRSSAAARTVHVMTSPLLVPPRRRRRPTARRGRGRALRRPVPRAARARRRRGVGRPVAPAAWSGHRAGPAHLAALADLPARRAPAARRADRGADPAPARPRRARTCYLVDDGAATGCTSSPAPRRRWSVPRLDEVLVAGRGRGRLRVVRRRAARGPMPRAPGVPVRTGGRTASRLFVPRDDLDAGRSTGPAGRRVWALRGAADRRRSAAARA